MVAEDSRWVDVASVKARLYLSLSILLVQRLLGPKTPSSSHTLQFLHFQTKFASPRLPPISFIS